MFVMLCVVPALGFDWDTAINEIFGGSEWLYHKIWLKCSWLFSVVDFLCWHFDTVPYGLLGKISSSSRKTNHKCAANVVQTTRREYVTSAPAILLCYFIIWLLFFLSCLRSHNYYHSYASYNKQYHAVILPSFVFADQLTLSFYFLINLIKLNKLN